MFTKITCLLRNLLRVPFSTNDFRPKQGKFVLTYLCSQLQSYEDLFYRTKSLRAAQKYIPQNSREERLVTMLRVVIFCVCLFSFITFNDISATCPSLAGKAIVLMQIVDVGSSRKTCLLPLIGQILKYREQILQNGCVYWMHVRHRLTTKGVSTGRPIIFLVDESCGSKKK